MSFFNLVNEYPLPLERPVVFLITSTLEATPFAFRNGVVKVLIKKVVPFVKNLMLP